VLPVASKRRRHHSLRNLVKFSKVSNLTVRECDIGFKCGSSSVAGLSVVRGSKCPRATKLIVSGVLRIGWRVDGSRKCSLPSSIKANHSQGWQRKATGRIATRCDSRAAENG
jgi:hypothetical protein